MNATQIKGVRVDKMFVAALKKKTKKKNFQIPV